MKKGIRYLNQKGEYCIVKSVYNGILKIQICGENARTEPWKIKDFIRKLDTKFWEIPFPKTDRTNIATHLLEYQLNMIGKTTADTRKEPNWFKEWTISERDYKFFEQIAIPLLKKTFKINRTKAISIFEWFNMQFGLNRREI